MLLVDDVGRLDPAPTELSDLRAAAREVARPTSSDLPREALEESYYQASRYGMEARLMVDAGEASPRSRAG